MGPMLVATLVGTFFVFAAIFVVVAFVFTVLAVWFMASRRSYVMGMYMIGSGFAGAAIALLIGLATQWNVVGGGIMKQEWVGYIGWGSIGYCWSMATAFVVGSLVRWLQWTKSEA